jgi:serine/threonine-protein kinase
MKLVAQFRAGKHVQKLKAADTLSPEELKHLQDELSGLGRGAIEPVAECLTNQVARKPALEVLLRLVNNYSLETFIRLLGSAERDIADGIKEILAASQAYEPARLVDMLAEREAHKGRLEPILQAQVNKVSTATLVHKLPELGRDAQAALFRVMEAKGDENSVPELAKLTKDEDWWIRMHAARLMAKIHDPAMADAVIELLKDSNKGVRYEAVHALHQQRLPSTIPVLVGVLQDSDLKVQAAAIDALIDFGDISAVKHLLVLLADDSEYVRRAAVEVLNEVATPEAIQDLLRALHDEDWWVRVRSADALGALGGEKVVQAVIGLMDEDDAFIRRQAVELLNSVPSQAAVDVLIRGLDDPDWWVRERSIDALGKVGDPRAVEPLIALLNGDEKTRALCARALGAIGDQRALEPLNELAGAESQEIRVAVSMALRALSAPQKSGKGRAPSSEPADAANAKRRDQPAPSLPFKVEARPPSPVSEPEIAPLGDVPAMPSLSPQPAVPAKIGLPPSPVPSAEPQVQPEPAPVASVVNYTDLAPGTVLLERYRIIRMIGKGGFGAVYLAEDSAIQEELILKVLNPQLSFDETAIRRFIRELKLTRKITHPNVIRIYDFLELAGAHAVSMEYFVSQDLAQILIEKGALSVERTLSIASEVCSGLIAAHAEEVTHRDMKPGNILVGKDDEVKIVDFGLASAQQQVESRLTKSGYLVGTPEYMAPEQIGGGEADHRVDIYALGVVLYEMLSGVKPFADETPVKIFFRHLEGAFEPLSKHVEGLPRGVEQIVLRAMAKESKDRHSTVEELKALIEEERQALGASS